MRASTGAPTGRICICRRSGPSASRFPTAATSSTRRRRSGSTRSPAREVPTTCTPDEQTLCLDDARFRVTATWTKPDASSGQGHAVALTGDTGYFWFFDSSNVEVIVKVLEACGVNGYRWVFASGLTNVQVNLTVTDVVTGTTNTYKNPQSTAFQAVQDTKAFSCP